MSFPVPPDEDRRLAALRRYEVLDSPAEEAFDDLTRVAAQVCQMPIAVISLLDDQRQWFKSRIGIAVAETPRQLSFCTHAILRPQEIMVIPDTRIDPRFAENVLVTGDPFIRFYAGAPLVSPDGLALGTLCVLDRTPRALTPDQLSTLRALSRQVMTSLELRRRGRELAAEVAERREAESTLREQSSRLQARDRESAQLLALAERSRRSLLSVLEDEKLAAQSLRESEERFRQLAENVREVFWITDAAKQTMLYVSPAYEAIWGRSCASLYAAPATWLEAVHPDDRERVHHSAVSRQAEGTYAEEYRITRPDGAVRWIRDRAFPVRNRLGQIYRVAGVAEDITERKDLEAQFFRAQRLEAIGLLASGIAHDMNNILTPIMMSTPLLRLGLPPEKAEQMLTAIEKSAARGAELVRQLLTFGRGLQGNRVIVDLRQLVREIARIAEHSFPKSIQVLRDTEGAHAHVRGDPTQLHQVLLNLCINARDAMPEGGVLRLVADDVLVDERMASLSPGARTGPHLRITVSDTGIGIPPGIIDRIFDPFFSTKPTGKGTGLGLSTVIGIVRSHGGFVTVESEVGEGTTFRVHLPADQEEAAAAAPTPDPLPQGRGELILIVDDEDEIRAVLHNLLAKYGYRVIAALNGADATAQYTRHAGEVRAVITDIDMPVLDGVGLIRALKDLNPAVPVLVFSGLASREGLQSRAMDLAMLGIGTILEKPYTAETVLRALHRLLAEPERRDAPR